MRERLSALKHYTKYWPVALFVVANMAAVALVIRAQAVSDESVSTSAIRRPTDIAADPTGAKPLDTLDLESARAAADVPMVLDWTKAPGSPRPSAEQTSPPGRSLIERLAMGLGGLRDDARAAYDRETRLSREAMLGIRSPLLNLGGLPPIGDPLLPAWNNPLIPPYNPLGLTRALTPEVELDPATMSPEYMAALIAELQRNGTPFKFVAKSSVAAVPPGVMAGMGSVRVRPVTPGTAGLMTALPGPPADVASPGAEPRLFSDGRPRLVTPVGPASTDTMPEPPSPIDAPRLTNAPDPHAPSGVSVPAPPRPTEVATSTKFMSATLDTQARAETVVAKLRAAGGSAKWMKLTSGPGYKVYCTMACRKSERRQVAEQLSAKAGVTMRLTS